MRNVFGSFGKLVVLFQMLLLACTMDVEISLKDSQQAGHCRFDGVVPPPGREKGGKVVEELGAKVAPLVQACVIF